VFAVENIRIKIMSEKANGQSMEKFTGKPSGMTFDRFDEKVFSWG
jgi:hypothetical protein